MNNNIDEVRKYVFRGALEFLYPPHSNINFTHAQEDYLVNQINSRPVATLRNIQGSSISDHRLRYLRDRLANGNPAHPIQSIIINQLRNLALRINDNLGNPAMNNNGEGALTDEEGAGKLGNGYIVQSVIFAKSKFTIPKAEKWLKKHKLVNMGVDEKPNTLRFRQIDPKKVKKMGFTAYRMKNLGNGIMYDIAYYHGGKMVAGSLSAEDLQHLLGKSYDKNLTNYKDFVVDKQLSDKRVQVYQNPKTGQVVVAHRGSADVNDWLENATYGLFGSKKGYAWDHSKRIQQDAEKKYGTQNLTTIGHSKGALHAQEFGKNGKEILTLNKPVNVQDILYKVPEKQTDVRTSLDPVSLLRPLQRGKKAITIESKTENPLAEHATTALERLEADKAIGAGRKKQGRGIKIEIESDSSSDSSSDSDSDDEYCECKGKKQCKKPKRPEFAKNGQKILYCGGVLSEHQDAEKYLKCNFKVGELKKMLKEANPQLEAKTIRSKRKAEVIQDLLQYNIPMKKIPTEKALNCNYKVGELKREIREHLTEKGKTKKEITAFLKGKRKAELITWADDNIIRPPKLEKIKGNLGELKKKENLTKINKTIEDWIKKYRENKKELHIPKPAVDEKKGEKAVVDLPTFVNKLQKAGEKKVVKYSPIDILGNLGWVSLLEKYGNKCLIYTTRDKNNMDNYKSGLIINTNTENWNQVLYTIDDGAVVENLGLQLQDCIKRGVQNIIIPLEIRKGNSKSAHANMLLYQPFRRTCIRFEPHGIETAGAHITIQDNVIVNKEIKKLFENALKTYIGKVVFIPPPEICPIMSGFQSLEGQIKKATGEGGGFCLLWALFMAEIFLINPEVPVYDLIQQVFAITKESPQYLSDVIRGYVFEVEKQIEHFLKLFKEPEKLLTPTELKALKEYEKTNGKAGATEMYNLFFQTAIRKMIGEYEKGTKTTMQPLPTHYKPPLLKLKTWNVINNEKLDELVFDENTGIIAFENKPEQNRILYLLFRSLTTNTPLKYHKGKKGWTEIAPDKTTPLDFKEALRVFSRQLTTEQIKYPFEFFWAIWNWLKTEKFKKGERSKIIKELVKTNVQPQDLNKWLKPNIEKWEIPEWTDNRGVYTPDEPVVVV